ncbi:uncharacterized protein FA14DRAFT_178078 [Meira miltonrushii]|uniref:Large ribosomal subunit protein mL46 n=1 Tax=Meira miltonrushii TaxID=1280837 RepID=A0A316VAZ3_9BASI|nr:uncharacterized protein FA14DRAFT_178078 [Meira miltonrushii]PWN34676.1 hypothetical protein FA14DRAFT_178078 [Meira miltonrushii]
MAASRSIIGESSSILRSCLRQAGGKPSRQFSRSLATEASEPSTESTPSQRTGSRSNSTVGTYFLLSRLPTVLPSLTPFESSVYAYNAKLERAISQSFPRDLYFKKGSAAETQFLEDEKERQAFMKGELKITDDATLSPSVPLTSAQNQTSTSRKTQADETNDVRSLQRSLESTLFLVVKGGKAGEQWTLPHSVLKTEGSESLHAAAHSSVTDLLGEDMDIWMVTNYPVGIVEKHLNAQGKGYVMRGHVLAGNAAPTTKGVDYAWLTKDELQGRLHESVWKDVEGLLSA